MEYPKLTWYRSSIDRTLLKDLTARKNLLPLIHILSQMCISAGTGYFAYWAYLNLPWPITVVAIYIHCTFYGFFGGGTGLHELSHGTVFRSKWLNEFFIRLVGFLTYGNFMHFRGNHTRHHLYTTQKKVDLEVMFPLEFKQSVWFWGLTIDLTRLKKWLMTTVRHCFGRRAWDTPRDNLMYPSTEPKEIRSMVLWSWIVLVGHVSLAALFVISGNWILLFIVTLAPFSCLWFMVLTHVPQHIGMEGNVSDWRRNSRTYLAGRFVRYFYWNMNYHVEHHMYAAVPFYHLPKLRKAIEFDLPVPPKGLRATWKEISSYIRKRKENPDYFIEPEFPSTASERAVH